MYGYEETSEVMGAFCSLIVPYKGYTEGVVAGDYGNELVVRLNSGKEIVVYKDEIIVYE